MIYPKFLNTTSKIGITAPSDGIVKNVKLFRLDEAKRKLNKVGYEVIETDNVRKSINGRSDTASKRANELEILYKDNDVNLILCSGGGEFLIEILPYINFQTIKNNVKWLQGYSDPTALLFIITTNLDIATVYGCNACSFGMKKWHKSLSQNLEILKGNISVQNSFKMFENNYTDYIIGNEEYLLDEKVIWKNLKNEEFIYMEGRIIGGCIDVILNLIGTKYDNTKKFIQKYKEDGIVWYFDNFGLNSEVILRAMWQLKNAGWFRYCNGIIFGRNLTEYSEYGTSFKDAILTTLDDLNIPIITDADIGHKPPQMTIINGSYVKVISKNGKGEITTYFK